ncbi:MAG: serine hydrolase [Bacteroidota bacterium]
MNRLRIITTCFLLFLNCKTDEKKDSSPETLKIQESVLLQKELFDLPGIAFGMIVNDTVVYANGHGVQALDTQEPMTSKSLFHMASVSKPFVATAIVQLVEKGKIDLDGKLTDYLPYFTMADKRYKDITIKHMLTHTSGIPDTDDYEWDKPQFDDGAAERYARSHKNSELDFSPGTNQRYSNPAFDILCDVIAKTSGMPFELYMEHNIFEPIGMKNSSFFRPEKGNSLATTPHIIGDSLQRVVSAIYPYNRRHAGSSTLHSNVEDMLLWAKVYLNKGTIEDRTIFSKDSYDLLTTIHTPDSLRKVALSWSLGKLNESKIYKHSGGDTGYRTFFGFMPEKKSAVVVMANSDNFWSTDSATGILKNAVFNDSIEPKAPIHLKLKDYILTEGMDKVKEIYFSEKEKSPQDYFFGGGSIDDLGYWLLNRSYYSQALEVFNFNTELEPEDAGWLDSVADAYREMDSTALAIDWYKKALEMKPDQEFSKKKLDELLNQVE